ncbi:hypothetical protein, partial [Candidatus Ichthyocystis sparus]|uniref:hypothetical protein n=1 Tax=Candidatus Ichthyocystis sparus TaxID=1561004 RepID=UPI001F5F9538
MKRKLSSANNEASSPEEGSYGQGDVDGQLQSSGALELEQSTGSSAAGGFVLTSRLAQLLGMQPGDMVFRGMFYGTPYVPLISSLTTQLLEEQDGLFQLISGEGTSSSSQFSEDYILGLVESSASEIQALLDSVEAPPLPPLAVAPEVVVGDVGTACGQASGAVEQSAGDSSCGGFLLAPDLAQSLGMQPGQMLCRGMFYNTPQSNVVLDIIGRLSEVREGLLQSRELERAGLIPEETGVVHEDTAALIETNEELTQALMASIEAPSLTVPSVVTECVGITHEQVPSAPEQSTMGSDGGFALAPYLAQSLGMQPGQMLCRGMFYNTPQSNVVLDIIGQLSEVREGLLQSRELERAGLIPEETGVVREDTAALIETNEELTQALMASIEAPSLTVPSVVTECVDITHEQVPSAPEQSTIGSDGGFALAPYLAQSLGMQPGQMLHQGMFYGTPQSVVVSEMVGQLSAIQEDLLRNLELEISGAVSQEAIGLDCEDTASLITTNKELLQALISSIEAPVVAPAVMAMEESESVGEEQRRLMLEGGERGGGEKRARNGSTVETRKRRRVREERRIEAEAKRRAMGVMLEDIERENREILRAAEEEMKARKRVQESSSIFMANVEALRIAREEMASRKRKLAKEGKGAGRRAGMPREKMVINEGEALGVKEKEIALANAEVFRVAARERDAILREREERAANRRRQGEIIQEAERMIVLTRLREVPLRGFDMTREKSGNKDGRGGLVDKRRV